MKNLVSIWYYQLFSDGRRSDWTLAQTKKNKLNYFSSCLLNIVSKFHFTSQGLIEEIDVSENTKMLLTKRQVKMAR